MKLQCSKKLFFLRWMELEIAPLASISPSQKRKKEKRTRDPMIIQHASKPRFNLKKDAISSSIATVLVPERSGPNFIPNSTSIFVANGFLMCSHDWIPLTNGRYPWFASILSRNVFMNLLALLSFFVPLSRERERENNSTGTTKNLFSLSFFCFFLAFIFQSRSGPSTKFFSFLMIGLLVHLTEPIYRWK